MLFSCISSVDFLRSRFRPSFSAALAARRAKWSNIVSDGVRDVPHFSILLWEGGKS